MADSFDLARFVEAQDAGGVYRQALTELQNGRKVSHWMWFVFPQLAGLGRSATAQYYALSSLAEAQAYLAHNVLGPRLLESSGTLTRHSHRSAREILGSIDALKLRSSMTLFQQVAPSEVVFSQVLDLFFAGVPDPATLALL